MLMYRTTMLNRQPLRKPVPLLRVFPDLALWRVELVCELRILQLSRETIPWETPVCRDVSVT
jgi:hypothetical protein